MIKSFNFETRQNDIVQVEIDITAYDKDDFQFEIVSITATHNDTDYGIVIENLDHRDQRDLLNDCQTEADESGPEIWRDRHAAAADFRIDFEKENS